MSYKNKKILIVEDDVALLNVLAEKFEREEMAVLKAEDGEEGLATALKERPDLILLDILMPKINGLEMLKNLRRDQWGASVPVLILTNLTDAEKIGEAIKRGAYEFLIKSDWSLGDIVNKVKDRLSAD